MANCLTRLAASILIATTLVVATTTGSGTAHAVEASTLEYAKFFDYSRKLLTRDPVRKFLRETLAEDLAVDPALAAKYGADVANARDISEGQLILLLQQNPTVFENVDKYLAEIPPSLSETPEEKAARKKWRAQFKELLNKPGVREEFRRLNNPLEPFLLANPDASAGYSNLKIYFTHPRIKDGQTLPADNPKAEWIKFIQGAKKQYVSNVFDFDLKDVAQALVDAAKRGVEVTQGIDKNVAEARPEVAEIVKFLREGGVNVHLVNSVGLNHQKNAARDWDLPGQGGALFSSGNLTQSCLGPEGDLVKFPGAKSKFSIPNANHLITMDSDLTANLINHELTKTLRPPYQLRGSDYPLSSAFKIKGTPYPGSTTKEPYIVVTFTPGGGLRDVGQNVISRILVESEGPVDMIQFANSSQPVEQALLARARREIEKTGKFEFRSVGDGPFAMQYWSRFLNMSGYELKTDGDKKQYVEIPDSEWRKALGEDGFKAFRDSIRMPPPEYGNHKVKVDGQSVDVSAKIHHKVIISQDAVNAGTSFNFSAAAQSNQEQFVVVVDRGVADEMRAALNFLHSNSRGSVSAEAARRNRLGSFDPEINPEDAHGNAGTTAALKKAVPNQACEGKFTDIAAGATGK